MAQRPRPVRVCKFCGGTFRRSEPAFMENPFCGACAMDRMRAGSARMGGVYEARVVGHYLEWVRVEGAR